MATLGVLAAGLLLAGCGGGAHPTSGEATAARGDAAGQATLKGAAGGAEKDAAAPRTDASTDARVLPAGRDIVYRATISVRVKDVSAAVDRAETVAGDAEGIVFAEQLANDPSAPDASSAHLTLRVPPAEFRDVLERLAGLGQRLSQSQTAEDVTTQVVDSQSRVASQRRSVERVRALLGQAKTVGEVVQIESELSRREADLESLESQLAKLKDVTALATVEVDLVGPAAPAPSRENLGFLAGLRGGWDAFVQIVLVGLTVLGAVLPFLLTLALIGGPVWLVARRLGFGRRAPAAEPPPAG